VLLALLVLVAPRIAKCAPLDPPAELLAAYELLRNGHYTEALDAARAVSAGWPDDPLPRLLEAQAHFDLIYCATGHINSRQVWHLTNVDKHPRDALFARALEDAARLAERMKLNPATAAEGHFLDGGAHGFRARLATLREQSLPSGRAGKRMREELLAAAALDKSFALEASFGLGMYDYFADALSPLVKLFRFFLMIPGGDMRRGLRQLHSAAEAGSLATEGNHAAPALLMQPEARWELARIVGPREGRHDEGVKLLAPLVERYPDNALFALLTALEAEAMGDQEMAKRYAQHSLEASARMDAACRPRIEPAAREALERINATLTSFAEPVR
jgi:hypothetical protein